MAASVVPGRRAEVFGGLTGGPVGRTAL